MKRFVFHPCLLILLDLWASLFACQPATVSLSTSPAGSTPASAAETATLTTIASFDGSNGSSPLGLVRAGDGNFYEVAKGGRVGAGAVFASFAMDNGVELLTELGHDAD